MAKLSQFLDSPTIVHYQVAWRVLRIWYLKDSTVASLFFPATADLKLNKYVNSDWGSYLDIRRSLLNIGYWHKRLVKLSGCSIFYMIFRLIMSSTPVAIFCDYQSALHNIAANLVFHELKKYIEIDCHIVRDKLQANVIHLLSISTKNQLANFLTKPLALGPNFMPLNPS